MRVVTLAGSPRYPSRSSALLEYARERLSALDVEVCHWHLHNFVPEDLLYARFESPALQALIEQLADADGLIVATPVYKASFSGALKTLLDLLPERALEGKVVLPVATGGTVAHMLAVDYALKPVLNALKAQEILHGVFADDSQIIDYQHKPSFTPNLQSRLDASLETFWQALHRRDFQAPSYHYAQSAGQRQQI
jgi:FMN reductase